MQVIAAVHTLSCAVLCTHSLHRIAFSSALTDIVLFTFYLFGYLCTLLPLFWCLFAFASVALVIICLCCTFGHSDYCCQLVIHVLYIRVCKQYVHINKCIYIRRLIYCFYAYFYIFACFVVSIDLLRGLSMHCC